MASRKPIFLKAETAEPTMPMGAENVAAILEALSKVCEGNGEDKLSQFLSQASQDVRNI